MTIAALQSTPTCLRIPLRCPVCRCMIAETDGAQRLFVGGALFVRRTGRLTVHCASCGEGRAHIDWYPRDAEVLTAADHSC